MYKWAGKIFRIQPFWKFRLHIKIWTNPLFFQIIGYTLSKIYKQMIPDFKNILQNGWIRIRMGLSADPLESGKKFRGAGTVVTKEVWGHRLNALGPDFTRVIQHGPIYLLLPFFLSRRAGIKQLFIAAFISQKCGSFKGGRTFYPVTFCARRM